MGLKLNKFSYDEIMVGSVFSFEKLIDEDLIKQFADFSGDRNPLHMDADYASQTEFGGRIVHGALLGSLFSALVGMLCPGEKSLYLSQSLNFKSPLKAGGTVIVEGEVISKSDVTKIVTLTTRIKDDAGKILVDGEAKAKVL